MNKLNILVYCTISGQGGIESYLIRSIDQFKKHNMNVFVGCKKNSYIDASIDAEKKYCINNKFAIFFNLIKLYKLFLIKNLIVHIHESKDLLLFSLMKLVKRDINIILTRHTYIPPKKDLYHKVLYKYLDILFVPSEHMKSQALKNLPISKSQLKKLPLGISLENKGTACLNLRKEIGADDNTFIIGCFARVVRKKGHHLILEALNILKNNMDTNIKVVFVGSIIEQEYYSFLTKKSKAFGLCENVHYLGFNKTPLSLMKQVDCVILPSYEDVFPLVILESMSLAVPVIASSVGGIPEIIGTTGENGLLFNIEALDELTNCIEKIYNDFAFRNKIARNGRKRVESLFCEDNYFIELLRVVNYLLHKKTS